ncbi:hypothetical protein LCGC14_1619580 [marine sediment metagenome]|uniref:Uncharacterized protein n=1 Tax=marine sediment metagenome TaxID=412755 RepID=A0A0F9L5S7_9ZZZZ
MSEKVAGRIDAMSKLERALAAFVDAYLGVAPGGSTPALDDAYDLAKDALQAGVGDGHRKHG